MTEQAKHTPGPWHLNTQYADIEVRGPAESGVLIAAMSPWGVAADGPNPQLANARLIAAAPDLLEELKKSVAMLIELGGSHLEHKPTKFREAVLDYATSGAAAIKRATGSAA